MTDAAKGRSEVEQTRAAKIDNLRDVWQLYRIHDLVDSFLSNSREAHSAALLSGDQALLSRPEGQLFLQTMRRMEHTCLVLEIGLIVGAISDPQLDVARALEPYLFLREQLQRSEERSLDRPLPRLEYLGLHFETGRDNWEWFSKFLRIDALAGAEEVVCLSEVAASIPETEDRHELLTTVSDRERVLHAVTKPAEERTRVEMAIAGLEILFEFSEKLVALLDSTYEDSASLLMALYVDLFASRPLLRVVLRAVHATVKDTGMEASHLDEFAAYRSLHFRALASRRQFAPVAAYGILKGKRELIATSAMNVQRR